MKTWKISLWRETGRLWVPRVVPVVKNPGANARDVRQVGSVPGLGRSPGAGHSNPLQCSCLENPMDRGDCRLWSVGSQSRT